MKRIAALLLVAIINLLSCNKSSVTQDSSLIGRWTLIETLNDPGDGSGKWMPVDNSSDYIQFNADGSAESPTNPYNGGVERYQVPADSLLILFYKSGEQGPFRYYIDRTTLTIMGGCIEACGTRYSKNEH